MKIRNKSCICRFCQKEFLAADVKATICDDCKAKSSRCECGAKKDIFAEFCFICRKTKYDVFRGKTYTEIYGSDSAPCGFQRGERNVAKRKEVREKIRKAVIQSYEKDPSLRKLRREQMIDRIRDGTAPGWYYSYNSEREERYQSRLEEEFAKLLLSRDVSYMKDYPVALSSSRTKLVDFFLLKTSTYVEISGFAYEEWQEDFFEKIQRLLEVLDEKRLVIFTYLEKLELAKEKFQSIQSYSNEVCILSIDQFETFIGEETCL